MNYILRVPLTLPFLLLLAASASGAADTGLQRLGPREFGKLANDERSANSAVFVGRAAALVVDPGLTPGIAQAFLHEVRAKIGAVPIKYVVLTHWHPDHALGILCTAGSELQIIAHPFTDRQLLQRAGAIIADFSKNPAHTVEQKAFAACHPRFPDHLIQDTENIDLGGFTVRVFHPGHAHTAGDLVVWAERDRVLASGDVFMHAASPYMGEADPYAWVGVLDSLLALHPKRVVAGHFGLSTGADLVRFRDYMGSLVTQVSAGLAAGRALDEVAASLDMHAFADFAQYPQYNATFAGNGRDVGRALIDAQHEFALLARLKVGKNPHQISFSADAKTAYVAAAGSDRVTRVDVATRTVIGHLSTPGVPLGVIPLEDGKSLAVTRFQGDTVMRYRLADGRPQGQLTTGGGPSLIQGPFTGNRYLISAEKANKLWLFNATSFAMDGEYDTGKRPFPAAATSDGKRAFVPNYDDGSVTVIDLLSHRVVATVAVGKHPSGGAVLPGDALYAVAVRGENRIALMDTASATLVGEVRQGIGQSPFSVVLATDGKRAFVNNTASNDVSVIDLTQRKVITRIGVGETPIVMAVHPDGKSLWVSCEGSHELDILRIPQTIR